MPESMTCPTCGLQIATIPGQAVQCPACAARARSTAPQPVSPAPLPSASALPLSYATTTNAATSPGDSRYRLTAVWCGITSALWIIAFALRQLLNSVCGLPERRGHLGFQTSDFTQTLFLLYLLGDLVALGASIALAAILGRIRQGKKKWIAAARILVWLLIGNFLVGLCMLAALIAGELDISVTMGFMDAFGLPAFIFSIVALVSLFRLRNVTAEVFWTRDPANPRHRAAGYACIAMAGLHVFHSLVALAFLADNGAPELLLLFVVAGCPFLIGVAYLLCGIWNYRNGSPSPLV